jgi:hypothetical protein
VAAEAAHDLLAVAHRELDGDLRVLVDEAHQQPRQPVLGGGDRTDAQRAGEVPEQGGELVAGLVPQRQQALGVDQQPLAGIGQPHAVPGAGHQRHARGGLEPADLHRDGGLAQVQLFRGQRHAAQSGHRAKGGQLLQGRVLGQCHVCCRQKVYRLLDVTPCADIRETPSRAANVQLSFWHEAG